MLMVVALGLSAAIVVAFRHTAPAPSSQEKNLETLKNVKKNDLVICISRKYEKAEIYFSFLVEENQGTYMTGYYPSKYNISPADDVSFFLMSAWHCEMHIYRPSETRIAAEILQSIILYGQRATPVP